MTDHRGEIDALARIIAGTPDATFEQAGGFAFTDEIAVTLEAHWRERPGGVVLSRMELAWLLEGYARARLSMNGGRDAGGET